ncbi:hypothetical protein [uncultured Erythrobacter sp.]|uniref:hypothetical protein n=1 Tax=uncultured Erythrobacter sp. TaxID=263913 RepID=UPI002627D522|nr:hypothetical protein [uncultured Erythrobacter sp.]
MIDFIGDLIIALGVLATLAMLGVGTLFAFALMGALNLVTELSFKRIFFISFGAAMILPLLLGTVVIGVLADDEVQDEIRAELRDSLPPVEEIRQTLPQLQSDLEDGTLDSEEIERLIEQAVPGADVQIDDGGIRINTPDDGVAIDINPDAAE